VLFAVAVSAALALLTQSPDLWVLVVGLIAFMLLYTGRISTWRSILFISMAWVFLVNKVFHGLLGFSLFVDYRQTFPHGPAQAVPNCHIAIGASILNYVYQQYLALKSANWSDWGPLSLGALWLVVPLVIGPAWCSWGCFYGGLDDGFSRILRKPAVRWFWLPRHLRDLPAAMLVFMALVSLSTMLPIFCLWVCPLKVTAAFLDTNQAVRSVQLAIFAVVGVVAVVLLSLLVKKRVFCGLVCPFGAWQSLVGHIHPVRVRIDPEKCTQCQRCLRVCPTFCISPDGLKRHRIGPYCNFCGECMDHCPEGAIRYKVFGREVVAAQGVNPLVELLDTRALVLFGYLLLGGAIGGLCIS
jgi:polyferredoxin